MATATEAETTASDAAPTTFSPHLLTVERYQRMAEAGVFHEDEPIFLWRGRLVETMTKHEPHSLAVLVLTKTLDRFLPPGWHARPQEPVAIGEYSMPEPDISIVRGAPRDYARRHPRADDVAILIEVADSSVRADSTDKLEAYAAHAIPCYWIVNIPARRVEVYTDPTGAAASPASYGARRDYAADESVPVLLERQEVGRVAVRELLPEPADAG